MKVIVKAELEALIKKILLAVGADERNADGVAEHLVSSQLSGVDTHGIWQLPGYVTAVKKEEILPTAWASIRQETPNSALVSGNWGFGQPACRYAMEVAIKKAESGNVAVVSLVEIHHTGRLGYYAEMAAKEGKISLILSGGYGVEAPAAMPYGGRDRVLHTNPISMGFPAGDGSPMIVDYATSAASGVKVVNAQRRGEKVPLGWIVDKNGVPSSDPNDFVDGGGHIAFGGHKGYGLMLAAEFLGPVFLGTDKFADTKRAGPVLRHQGVTMIVFKADMFQPFSEYAQRADEFGNKIRAVRPATGFEEVLIPGDLEARTRKAREKDGIPIADDTWQSVVDVAGSLGVEI